MGTEMSGEREQFKRLEGKVALVTGGGRGIGLAIAQALAGEGAQVVITGRDRTKLDQAVAVVGPRARGAVCDVRSEEMVAALVSEMKSRYEHFDLLVNNAGVAGPSATVEELSASAWREVLDTNLTGTFLVTHAALPVLSEGASIVNIASVAAKVAFPGMSAYAASKSGIRAFSNVLREELRSRGIRVMTVLPGAVATDIWDQFWPGAPRNKMMSAASIAETILTAVTLPPGTSVDEITVEPTAGKL